jgi:predicted ribosome quality control (RQC) complex YloA/Tae2 family protein
MSIDGLFTASLAREISERITGGRIDRVSMPDRYRVMISIRHPGTACILAASIHPERPRLSLTYRGFDDPEPSPAFCSVLRRHLLGGRIRGVRQPGLERLLAVQVERRDEHGRMSLKDFVIELMGKHSNMLLLDSDSSTIIDCARHITSRVNRHRELLPGRPYVLPPSQRKADLTRPHALTCDGVMRVLSAVETDRSAKSHLVDTLQGFGPLTAAEVLFRSGVSPDLPWSGAGKEERKRVSEAVVAMVNDVLAGVSAPCVYIDSHDGRSYARAFSFTRLTHLLHRGFSEKVFPTLSELLDFALADKEAAEGFESLKTRLAATVAAAIGRTEAKLAKQVESLDTAQNAEKYKLYADLLMANAGTGGKGCKSVQVVDYFDPNMPLVTIELDPSLTVIDNARLYYRRYVKAKRSKDKVEELVRSTAQDLEYLRQVESGLLCASTLAELEEIRSELAEQGFLSAAERPETRRKASSAGGSAPAQFTSIDGVPILVGKNNRQNDELTLRLASHDDIWLHAKDLPGSHVIVKTRGLKVVPDTTLTAAALLAAYFSKARNSSGVPVDYTLRKHVRKPPGAKPGMVIYDSQSTVYVTPTKDALARYLADASQLV